MSYQFWHNCFRLSSVVFPVSSVLLFFTPQGTEQAALLALVAVASAGLWQYSSVRRVHFLKGQRRRSTDRD